MASSSPNNKMSYNVYLVDDNKVTQDDQGNIIKYFDNEQIEFALIKNGTYVAGTSSTYGKKLTDVTGFTTGSTTGEGLVLENQEIIANSKDSYKLRIWISDDVNYSNTIDENGTMIGKFNGYKYSLKVKVTSGVETTTTVSEPVGRVIVANLADSNGISAYGVSQSEDPTTVTDWIEVSEETAKSNIVRTANAKVTSKTIQHKVDSYGTYYLHVKNTLNEVTTKKVDVKINEVSKDTSGAATPVIKGDLVPVIMNGSDVIKADTTKGWYNYDQSIWANAVILNDNYGPYENGSLIPEEAIESYFVWIPRYEYKIFNEGNYTTLVEQKENVEQEIEIKFVTKEDEIKNGSSVGTWLTHPAFISFDSNGMWVGKFESGYSDSYTTIRDLRIKANMHSLRNLTTGKMFNISYEYNRELDSHMMKNTEWGAVAYLSHSKYGAKDSNRNVGVSIRLNNNKGYITGYSAVEEPVLGYKSGEVVGIEGNRYESVQPTLDGIYSLNYFNILSVLSSTTSNYTGIYDMSGGAFDAVMAYNNSSTPLAETSEVTLYYPTFFEDYTKYYDEYKSTDSTTYNKRILGDATGEMGPFYNENDIDNVARIRSSWYSDWIQLPTPLAPWIHRGGVWDAGKIAGIFSGYMHTGAAGIPFTFRVVLTPQE